MGLGFQRFSMFGDWEFLERKKNDTNSGRIPIKWGRIVTTVTGNPIVEENELHHHHHLHLLYSFTITPLSSSLGFDGNKRKNTINVTNQIASHHRRHLMSMEPSLLLLALYSEDELRRGGETSDGAAASNHLATVTDLLDH
ncbi:hypothetical protein YC2023_018437 [Brassica napus]